MQEGAIERLNPTLGVYWSGQASGNHMRATASMLLRGGRVIHTQVEFRS
jgi:hypothetical protein